MSAPTIPNPEHTGLAELARRVAQAKTKVEIGGRYRHYRGGTYRVLDIGFHEADEALMVIYALEYGPGLVSVRLLSSWLETVEVDGHTQPRFERITE